MTTKNTNAKSATITAIADAKSRKGDAAMADDRGAAERAKALQAANDADSAAGTALVACIVATIHHGATSADEVMAHFPRCNNPGVYASYFNRGHKAQAVLGIAQAQGLVDRIVKSGGGSFLKVREGLKAAMDAGKESTGKAGAPVKLADARKIVAAAAKSADQAGDKSKDAKRVTRGTRAPNEQTATAALASSGQSHKAMALSLRIMVQEARKLGAPEARESAYSDAMAALEEACDAWGLFA